MKKDPFLEFSQAWLFESLLEHSTFYCKKMFGGLAIYLNGKNVACLMEDPKQNFYKDKVFDYPIWNGILWPTDFSHHESLKKEFPNLVNHPVLGKWLYLPLGDAAYEKTANGMIELILSRDPRLGIVPGLRTKGKKKKVRTKTRKKAKRPSK